MSPCTCFRTVSLAWSSPRLGVWYARAACSCSMSTRSRTARCALAGRQSRASLSRITCLSSRARRCISSPRPTCVNSSGNGVSCGSTRSRSPAARRVNRSSRCGVAWRPAEPLPAPLRGDQNVAPVTGAAHPVRMLDVAGLEVTAETEFLRDLVAGRGSLATAGSGRAEEVAVGSDGFAGCVGVGGGAEEYDHAGDVVGVSDGLGCGGAAGLVDELGWHLFVGGCEGGRRRAESGRQPARPDGGNSGDKGRRRTGRRARASRSGGAAPGQVLADGG